MSLPDGSRSRSFTWDDPAVMALVVRQKPGLEYLREIAAGELAPPPVAQMLGFSILEVEPGRAAMDPEEWMHNPIGSVHGGIAATLLDSCMGCAVHAALEPGVGYYTGSAKRESA